MSRINLENSDSTAQSVSDRLLTLLKTRGPQQASDAGKVLGTTGELPASSSSSWRKRGWSKRWRKRAAWAARCSCGI